MYPKIGQNIVVNLVNQSQSCKSIIADVGETEILIATPMKTDLIGLLTVDTPLEISFVTNGNKYKFKTEIIGRKKDNIPLFRVKKPLEKEILKVQLRENFRVNANLRVWLNGEEQSTINLSAGGILCSCNQNLEVKEKDEISGTFILPNSESDESDTIEFKGIIVRINQVPKEERTIVGIKFSSLNSKDQGKLIQYCFEKQRQMRMAARK